LESSDICGLSWGNEEKSSFVLEVQSAKYEFESEDKTVLQKWFTHLDSMRPVGFSLKSEEVIFEGLLYKQKEKGRGFSTKKKRYCVMDEYNLHYFEKKGGVQKGQLELIGLKMAKVVDRKDNVVGLKLLCVGKKGKEIAFFFFFIFFLISVWIYRTIFES
jgi:hypothetical protein